MKNIILVLIIALFSSNLLATSTLGGDEKKCRLDVTNNNAALSLEKQLHIDLLSGIWTTESFYVKDLKAYTSLQFTPNGLVGVLTKSEGNITNYTNRVWSLKMTDAMTPVLILTDLTTDKEHIYQVKRHCDGLDLTHIVTGEKTQLLYNNKKAATQLKATLKSLTGSWKCMMMPDNAVAKSKNIKRAFYQYELNKDGSITKTLDGNNITAIVQEGFWQVSPDGQYLLMHFQEAGYFKTSVAQINHLAFDELVLGQCTATSDMEEGLCAEMDSFYFNKQ